MLKECKTFYQNLCSKFQTCNKTQNQLLQNIPKTVTTEHNENLTKTITKTEIKEAIFQMENNESPGIDGIPIEFYKEFLAHIENDLLQLYQNILQNEKETAKTMKQAIITLKPKKGDLQKLRYWRPISLLCADYKILTKIVANRLQKILPQIISEEQNCSIPHRTIFNNLCLTRDAIRLAKEKNTKFYILQIDQEKAFDNIDHKFPYKTMQKMGFSEQFITYIKILYQNNISMIINNRFLSAPGKLQRGLRQGCALSLPLYVVQGQVTTANINKDSTIQGIKIPNKKIDIKLSQYADDSNFFLASQESAENVLKFFQKLHLATGEPLT